jgi:NADPH-dependent curcumin reductase CurA
MPNTTRQGRLVARPNGFVAPGDLQPSQAPLPVLQDGQALSRVNLLSIDPTMRVWMADTPQYMPPVAIGEIMRAFGLAEIVESRRPDFHKGDKVVGPISAILTI